MSMGKFKIISNRVQRQLISTISIAIFNCSNEMIVMYASSILDQGYIKRILDSLLFNLKISCLLMSQLTLRITIKEKKWKVRNPYIVQKIIKLFNLIIYKLSKFHLSLLITLLQHPRELILEFKQHDHVASLFISLLICN